MLETTSWLSVKASSKSQCSSSDTSFTDPGTELPRPGCCAGIAAWSGLHSRNVSLSFTSLATKGGWKLLLRSTAETSH